MTIGDIQGLQAMCSICQGKMTITTCRNDQQYRKTLLKNSIMRQISKNTYKE
ncbi:hypothetical protein [Methanofollis sp. UBA420]|jgi:hypothetical protein|uniref:hypothetical protein n=1 Tax=Methanofollis sp. UBA420 TaxID=1915514 RepID=UPI00316ACE20